MTGVLAKRFTPIARNAQVYTRLYQLYKRLHALCMRDYAENQFVVMKELLAIRDAARRGGK